MSRIFLHREKPYYKGSLHLHSQYSDGQDSEDELVEKYKRGGFDFIAISDHRRYYNSDRHNTEHFLVLPAYEMDTEDLARRYGAPEYHLHGILDLTKKDGKVFEHGYRHEVGADICHVSEVIAEMCAHNNLIILNHPRWSELSYEQCLDMDAYFALEIYNHGSETEEAAGFSLDYYDRVLQSRRKVWAIATDDCHGRTGRAGDYCSEYFGGWISLQAEDFTAAGLVGALKAGSFYSSMGPEIKELRLKDAQLQIECSEVERINFITQKRKGTCVLNYDGRGLTGAQYELSGAEEYVRVECIDRSGKIAWTNPVFFPWGSPDQSAKFDKSDKL